MYHCGKCKLEVVKNASKEEDESINCNKCHEWYHRNCSDLGKQEFNILLRGNDKILYICNDCLTSNGVENRRLDRIEESVKETNKTLKDMMK